MKTKKDRQTMDKLDSCYKLVEQSSGKGGIRATEIGEKMGVHRTTAHNYLTSLELMGKVFSDQGLWKVKSGEQTIKPLEKEIVIELPIPKKDWKDIARLQLSADTLGELDYPESERMITRMIETYNKTRTITIRGKNVDDLDLEKIAIMTQEANENSSKINLQGLIKKFKK